VVAVIRAACVVLVVVVVGRGAVALGGGDPVDAALWLLLALGSVLVALSGAGRWSS